MKKEQLILMVLGLFGMVWTAAAQCWSLPNIKIENVDGIISNENYKEPIHFVGAATFDSLVHMHKTPLVFDGDFVLDLPLNLNDLDHIYVQGNTEFKQLHFNKGDTLYVSGSAKILKIVSNNSNINHRNVIVLSEGSKLEVEGKIYHAGDTIHTANNSKSDVDVIGCGGSTLPVTFDGIDFSGNSLIWSMGDQSNVDHFDIEGSNNGMAFKYVRSVPPNHHHQYSIDLTSYLVFGSLLFLPLAVGKRSKWGLFGCMLLIVGAIACSKSDVNPTNVHYKMWRVAAITSVGDTIYSPIISR